MEVLRQAVKNYATDIEADLNNQIDDRPLSERVKNVALLQTLVKTIEDIAKIEERFNRAREHANVQELDGKQRQDLAKRIEALRRRD